MTVIQPINVPQPVKLTIEQFQMLDRSGAFDSYAKTELIEGAIYAMQGQFRRHSYAKNELTYRLRRRLEELGSDLLPQSEATVSMPPSSAPEPDIVLTREPRGESYVPLESVQLLIEISDSSISFDTKEKAHLYALQSVPEYWVVDLTAGTIHQLWQPSPAGYQQGRSVPLEGTIESITIAGLQVDGVGLI